MFTDQILVAINSQNIDSILDMMTDFESVEKVLRRLKGTRLSMDFQNYRQVLLNLEKRFENNKSYFTTKIQKLLPRLRQKKAEETELTDLIKEYNNSPYEKETFLALLAARQKEIETAEFIIYNDGIHNKDVSGILQLFSKVANALWSIEKIFS